MEIATAQHSSQLTLPYIPPLQQNHVDTFIGHTVSLITNYNLRYEGVIYHLSLQDSTLVLGNVMCYGTEERSKDGLHIPPWSSVYSYILFRISEIKAFDLHHVLAQPPLSLPKGVTSGKPPRPPIGSKLRKKVPKIANEKLENPQDVASLVNSASSPYVHPQLPGSYCYDPWSSHYLYPSFIPYQAASVPYLPEMMYPSRYQGDSFFFNETVPITLRPKYGTRTLEFEWMRNMKQYNLWGNEEEAKPALNIYGSSYKISRSPFDPIATPHNPYGPIARITKYHPNPRNFYRKY